MRKVTIRKPRHIPPFNEPASKLRILNKPLTEWQRGLLAPYCDYELTVDHFYDVPRDTTENYRVGRESVVRCAIPRNVSGRIKKRRTPTARASVPLIPRICSRD